MFSIQYSPPQAVNLTEGWIQGAQVGANIASIRASERASIRNYMANMAQIQESARQFNIGQRETARQFNINKQLAQKENELTRRKLDFNDKLSLANLDINRGNLEVERFKATESAKRSQIEENATYTPEPPSMEPLIQTKQIEQEFQAQAQPQRVNFVNPYEEQQRQKFEETQIKVFNQQQQQQPAFEAQPFTLASFGGRGFGGYQDFLT